MTTTDFEEPSHSGFRDFCEPGSGSDAAPFIEMVNDIDGFGLAQFGIEQGRATSFGKVVLAAVTAQ